jgi:hypothetical protein
MRLPRLLTFLGRHRPVPLHHKELTVQNKEQPFIYSEEQLMARLKFFIGICLALTLTGIVFVVLYSIIFVTQPLNAMSPIDQKFFELIIPIATFLTGTLSGIMLAGNKKEDQEAMLAAQKQAAANADSAAKSAAASNTSTTTVTTSGFGGAPSAGFNPAPSWGTPVPAASTEVTTGWGGKAAPPPITAWPER